MQNSATGCEVAVADETKRLAQEALVETRLSLSAFVNCFSEISGQGHKLSCFLRYL
jgi:hypothetical protein